MPRKFNNPYFDLRTGVLLDEVQIDEIPLAAETVTLPNDVLGDRAIQAVKAIAEPGFLYREAKLSRDGKDYWIVGENGQIRAQMFAVLGIEDQRWVPLNKQASYADLLAVSARWSGLERLPVFREEDLIDGVRTYADRLRAELAADNPPAS